MNIDSESGFDHCTSLGMTVTVPRCLQNSEIMDAVSGGMMNLTLSPNSEDCLYLNIYAPAHAHERSNLPVSVKLWSDYG